MGFSWVDAYSLPNLATLARVLDKSALYDGG